MTDKKMNTETWKNRKRHKNTEMILHQQTNMKAKQKQVIWKLRSVKTITQYQEGKMEGNVLSASRRSLEVINMTPNSPELGRGKIFYA